RRKQNGWRNKSRVKTRSNIRMENSGVKTRSNNRVKKNTKTMRAKSRNIKTHNNTRAQENTKIHSDIRMESNTKTLGKIRNQSNSKTLSYTQIQNNIRIHIRIQNQNNTKTHSNTNVQINNPITIKTGILLMAEFVIQEMTGNDIDAVLELDLICFSAPWNRESYEKEVNENDFAHYFIIKTDEKVIGYVGLWLVLEDAQVTNIAIAPEFRGYGIGEQLFGFALQYLLKQGAKQLSLEVRKSNEVAQNLYKKFGLKKGGVRKNYYPDNGEDAF